MWRLLRASLALLLLILPFQAGSEGVAPAMPCCPCTSTPACPPACPAPTPSLACMAVAAMASLPAEAPAADAQRGAEASPVPVALVAETGAPSDAPRPLAFSTPAGPPDRGDGQALLRVFRI
ncbi:MAG TPA: hypothetical protein VFF76_09370 [Holophagaceae bacterium]|nr:hypothetical protein [Holophagaceae bacterium]